MTSKEQFSIEEYVDLQRKEGSSSSTASIDTKKSESLHMEKPENI